MDAGRDGGIAPGGDPDEPGDERQLFTTAVDVLAVLDRDGIVLRLNPAGEQQLGRTEREVAGTSVLDLVHAEDHPLALGALAAAESDGEPVTVELRLRSAGGAPRWFRCSGRTDHRTGRVYVTAIDIDERRTLEESLRARVRLEELVGVIAADLLRADAATIPAGIEDGLGRIAGEVGAELAYFVRATGRQGDLDLIEWASPHAGSRMDDLATLPEREGRWWGDVLRAQAVLRVDDLERLEGDGAELTREVLGRQGVRSLLLVPMPPRRRHAGFVSMVRISEARPFSPDVVGLFRVAGEVFLSALDRADSAAALADATHELERRNRELERSNEELERFAHATAHDLRAPLARIEMALSSLGPMVAGDDTAAEVVAIAARGAASLRALIEDLLAYASAGEGLGPPVAVDLDEVVAAVLADLDAEVERAGAEVHVGELAEVLGHATLLRQLVQNLVANALTFRRSDVTPTVRIEVVHDDAAGVVMSVIDNGLGIPADRREGVFSMFTRLHPKGRYPGSGIGLATCSKVVAHLGGRIWIDDGIDGGTAVRVWLPEPGQDRSG